MALRAVTVGYGYKRIADAAIKQIMNGNNLTRPSVIELEAAEKLVSLFEGLDMVKFAKNGSTVTTAAIKLARAYTGKKYIARCLDHPFFSYDDWFIGDTIMDRGIPQEGKELTLNFNFNDLTSLENLFEKHGDDIAAVILEPSTTVEPENNFLHEVKRVCEENNSVFILDEMITGFRFDIKGAQHYYNIIPHLATFGKGMANGFSVAALVGERKIMEIGGIDSANQERVFLISTTHGAEMCGLGALSETIDVYNELGVTDHLWNYGKELKDGMNKISAELGLSEYFEVVGPDVNLNYITKNTDKIPSLPFRTLFSQEMINNGVLMPWIALSYSHGDKELEKTLDATQNTLKKYKLALENGIDGYLDSRPIKPVFRKEN